MAFWSMWVLTTGNSKLWLFSARQQSHQSSEKSEERNQRSHCCRALHPSASKGFCIVVMFVMLCVLRKDLPAEQILYGSCSCLTLLPVGWPSCSSRSFGIL
eukprot:180972-Amphidinium_carterae.1